MTEEPPRVKATEHSFQIIEIIRDAGGIGLADLAAQTEISKSAVYKHVQTLLRLGYLVREDDMYYLSNRFLSFGRGARERLPLDKIRSIVTDLAATTGNATNFIVHETEYGIYSYCIEPGEESYLPFGEGDIAPLHATAGGKAILAHLAADEREELVRDRELQQFTDKTITDAGELMTELSTVRSQRVAFDREEYVEGFQCVASPIIGSNRVPIGAVSVTGNIQRMSGKRLDEDVTGLVTSAAKSIENEILSA